MAVLLREDAVSTVSDTAVAREVQVEAVVVPSSGQNDGCDGEDGDQQDCK